MPNFKYPDNLSVLPQKNKLAFGWTIIKKTFAALGRVEKVLVFALILISLFSSAKLVYNFWIKNTVLVPTNGGILTEGIIGNPRFINPIFSQAKDADTDLAKLIFSPLFAPDQNGELKPDAAEGYDISDDKKTYTIKIRNSILWHDGERLTADDVLFTVKAIQNPNYKSPLRGNLTGIESEKIDDFTIKMSLKSPYEPFLQNLTFGILPSHIWRYINSDNTPLAEYNIKPIGSGPFRFEKFTKDKNGKIISFELKSNDAYYGKKPLIENVIFKFFDDPSSLAEALNSGQIDATAYLGAEKESEITRTDIKRYSLKTPGYFAVFFNQERSPRILTDKNVRMAVNYLTDKNQLVSEVLKNNGQKTETPIPPVLKEYSDQTKIYAFDPSYAATILTNLGWVLQDDNSRAKEFKKEVRDSKNKVKTEMEKIPLELTLTTGDSPELEKAAETLKDQWQKGGLRVNLEFLSADEIQSAIKDRDYEALLFGEILNIMPDPFIFWHSSEIKDPGLNLALYSNKNADKMLEDIRQTFDPAQKTELLAKFQTEIVDDTPAVFLFNRYLSYWTKTGIEGMETKFMVLHADRFASVANWSLVKKRVWRWEK